MKILVLIFVANMSVSIRVLFTLLSYATVHRVQGEYHESCNYTKTLLEICNGSESYLHAYPSTYGKNSLEITSYLAFLSLADFNAQEKSVTVFISLMMEWNDTRISLNTYK